MVSRRCLSLAGLLAAAAALAQDAAAPPTRLGAGGRVHESDVVALAFSSDGQHLATASDAGREVAVWDVARGTIAELTTDSFGRVGDLRFAADGRELLVATRWELQGHIAIVESGTIVKCTAPDAKYAFGTFSVAPIASSALLAVACEDRVVFLLDPATDKSTAPSFLAPFSVEAFSHNRLLVSADGRLVAYRTTDESLGVFGLDGRGPSLRLECRSGRLAAAFAPSGMEIASVSSDGTAVNVFDTRTGEERTTLQIGGERYVEALWFTDRGASVAALLDDGTLWTCDTKRGRPRERHLPIGPLHAWPREPHVSAFAATSDGRTFAVAIGAEVRVFDTESARERVYK